MNNRIGYACMNMDTEPNIFKTCRINSVTQERLIELIDHNLEVLEAMIDYNIKHGNKMYRVSSSLIPFASNEVNCLDWQNYFKSDFERIRKKIKGADIRISCHPGQYTVINSKDTHVIERSIKELEYHSQLMELLSGDSIHKMILHVGGVYDDKQESMERFIQVYKTRLSENIKKYLVIENDDRLYTVEDILYISNKIGIPLVFDNLHHLCNPSLEHLSIREILDQVRATWPAVMVPKMHYSQQDKDKRMGAHSYTIHLDAFDRDYEGYIKGNPIDIMLEVKDKNRSFMKVDAFLYPKAVKIEGEWARYKYLVMAHSIEHYKHIRTLFKNNPRLDVKSFYHVVDDALNQDLKIGNQINAFDHIWGYFKKHCSSQELEKYLKSREAFREGHIQNKVLIRYLEKMAIKYEVRYLLDSYYFTTLLSK